VRRHVYFYTLLESVYSQAARVLRGDPATWLPEPVTRSGEYWRLPLHADGALPRPVASHPAEVEIGAPVGGEEGLVIPVAWHSARADRLLPTLNGELQLESLAGGGSHLSMLATYRPPLSVLGEVGDIAVGRRVAEACVRRFVLDVAARVSGVTLTV
jgi:hypothetical protein